MNNPVFSIIIPTYNASVTLSECLLSLIGQSYRNFEIIILDSLSTDDTIKICKSFADDRIKIISEKDNGIYDAMNKGINKANGLLLYFMGSDDSLFSPEILERVYENFNNHDIIYGNVNNFYLDRVYDGEFDDYKISQQNICHQAIFYKKEVFTKVGNFNLRYKALSDWDHNLKWWFSKKIDKQYIDLVIANFAGGGFSSQNPDLFFLNLKNWKINVLKRNELSLIEKMSVFKIEFFNAINTNRRQDALQILLELPKFLY